LVAKVAVEMFLDGFDGRGIFIGKGAFEVLSDHFTPIMKHVIHQKTIDVGLHIEKPIGMDGEELHP
jgi:hypothetical protein